MTQGLAAVPAFGPWEERVHRQAEQLIAHRAADAVGLHLQKGARYPGATASSGVAAMLKGSVQPAGHTLGTCIERTLSRVMGLPGTNSIMKACR